MKKISFILLALLCWSSMVSAQENNNRLRKKYRNLSFVKQEFEPASYSVWIKRSKVISEQLSPSAGLFIFIKNR